MQPMLAVYLNNVNTAHIGQQRSFLRVSPLKFSGASKSQHPLLNEYDDIFRSWYIHDMHNHFILHMKMLREPTSQF